MDSGANTLLFWGGDMDWVDWVKILGLGHGGNGLGEFISKVGENGCSSIACLIKAKFKSLYNGP